MEQKNNMMIFTDDEQRFGGIAAATGIENAPRIHTRISEVLEAERERHNRLCHADDDEITRSERSEIPSLAYKVDVLGRLSMQLEEVQGGQFVEDVTAFLRDEEY